MLLVISPEWLQVLTHPLTMVALPVIVPFLISVRHGGIVCDCTITDIRPDMVVLHFIVPLLISVPTWWYYMLLYHY